MDSRSPLGTFTPDVEKGGMRMTDNKSSSSNGRERSRRDFLSKSTRVLYVAPLVASYDIAEFYNPEEEGYAQAPRPTPYPHHHGEK